VLEDPNACAICGAPVKGYVGGVPVYFCPHCFRSNKEGGYCEDILEKAAWAMYLLGVEKARRKRRNRLMKSVGLPVFIYGIPHEWEAGHTVPTRLYAFTWTSASVGG